VVSPLGSASSGIGPFQARARHFLPHIPTGTREKRRGTLLKNDILEIFKQSIRLKEHFIQDNLDVLEETIRALAGVIGRGNKILLFGNGGSAADAQHIAAEFVNRYLIDRPPLPAIALTTDSSVLTAVANDFSFEEVFEKQIKALGRKGDAAVGISTSGSSANVLRGLRAASELGLVTVGLGGNRNSPMQEHCRHYLWVEGGSTPRIQEVHAIIGHVLVEMIDHVLFGSTKGPSKG
jgi:D-sedoheptulose 7-phosphate isomerase